MNIIFAIAVSAAVIWWALYVVEYVRNDDLRRRNAPPPRSHEPDLFEPPWNQAA